MADDPWAAFNPQAAADDPWAAFNPQPTASVGSDIAHSALAGLERIPGDIAGMPNATGSLVDKGASWLTGKLGFDPTANSAAITGLRSLKALPSTEQAQSAVQDVTGKFYEPQTRYGRIAETTTEVGANPLNLIGGEATLPAKAAVSFASGLGSGVGKEVGGAPGEIIGGLASGAAAARIPGISTIDTTAVPSAATTLARHGNLLTPGQAAGGIFKRIEDAATSIPILGDFIRSGREKSIASFNKATINQSLEPIGEQLAPKTEAGHEAIDEAATKLGKAYDTLLPQLTFVPDAQYGKDLTNIANREAAVLPQPAQDQFNSIMNIYHGPPATMDGQTFKDIQGDLKNFANQYRNSSDTGQRQMAYALDKVDDAMVQGLERSNPGSADELNKINTGYAMYSRIRAAAARRTTSGGVFTPNDLLASVKSADKSVGRGSFARGNALMQTWGEAGQAVLPSTLPDSGTARRLMSAEIAKAPFYLATAVPAAPLYSKPAMALNRALSARPSRTPAPLGTIPAVVGADALAPPEKYTPSAVPDRSPASAQATTPAAVAPPVIATKEQYDALPSGTKFVGSDGKRYTRP